jgi:nucleoside-diphosphate-sugar epimerase
MGKKNAFVNYGNSREGKAIADALKEEGYFVYATRRPNPDKLDHLNADPLSIDQFIDKDMRSVVETMKICNLIVYTILDTPKFAIEYLTKLNEDPGVRKTIVIVSPIFTWAGDPRTEEWQKRWPGRRYEEHLGAERFLTDRLQLRIYVMCVGLLYGDGEGILLPVFRTAWLLKPAGILEQNHNVIPTLHVRDMAHGAVALGLASPEARVIVAHDGSGTTQRALIKSINAAFGAGKTPKVTEAEAIRIYGRETVGWLKLDLELECEEFSGLDFERHCSNPTEEVESLVSEFVENRHFSPLRLLGVRLPSALYAQIIEYYGVCHATLENMKAALQSDKSEDALALKEQSGEGEEEQKIPDVDVIRFVLANNPSYKNQGYVLPAKLVPKDLEEREALFLEDDEAAVYMPKYILVWPGQGQNIADADLGESRKLESPALGEFERWFIAKGSHCAFVRSLADVQKFLGLPRNFTRDVKIQQSRREREQLESELEDAHRKEVKHAKRQEEERVAKLKERDAALLAEVNQELASMEEVRQLSALEYLKKYIVPMFLVPLRQINEARPDDPLRFLAAHFEKEAQNP